MSGDPDLGLRAWHLGYGYQACLSREQIDHLVEIPVGLDHLWILCNVGDAVQRRWMQHRTAEDAADQYHRTPTNECGPLDAFCRHEISALLGARHHHFIYPAPAIDPAPPVLAILTHLGLYRPSPIMSTLHERFGSWWAVRAAVAVNGPVELPPVEGIGSDPCVGCAAPCLDACPAQAVSLRGWQWRPCAEQRCGDAGPCADRCPARLACPAGDQHKYSETVFRYHYLAALPTMRHALRQYPAKLTITDTKPPK